ncbi:MAG: hypothetical protein ABFD89_23445 [Bryobacteraceae bacterium]
MDTITQADQDTGSLENLTLLQVSIPEDLHKRIRHIAAERRSQGVTIKSLVTEILERSFPPSSDTSNDTQGE